MLRYSKRPVVFPVGGVSAELSFSPLLDDFGVSEPANGTLTVDPAKHQDQHSMDRTTFHEIMHIALYRSGWDEVLGEKQAEAMCVVAEMAFTAWVASTAAVTSTMRVGRGGERTGRASKRVRAKDK